MTKRDELMQLIAVLPESQVESVLADLHMRVTLAPNVPDRDSETKPVLDQSDAFRTPGHKPLTVADMRASGIIGLWKDHKALGDSAEYARQLRTEAWERRSQD